MLKYKERLFLVISAIFILGICLLQTGGPAIAKDSSEYIAMNAYLPALYPCFLWLLRSLFGIEIYCYVAIIIQTVLAVYATLFLKEIICNVFNVQHKWEQRLFFLLLLMAFFTGGTGIADGVGSANLWILTEGLCYPLFYLFVGNGILFLQSRQYKNWRDSLFLSILLALCRDQFWACFGIVFLEVVFLVLFRKEVLNKILFYLGTILVACMFVIGLQRIYENNAVKGGEAFFHRQTIATHLLFFAEETDVYNIKNEGEREIFLLIYNELKEQELLQSTIEGGWLPEVTVYRKMFGKTGSIMSNIVVEYAEAQTLTENLDIEIRNVMTDMEEALKAHVIDWIYMSVVKLLPIIFTMTICVYIHQIAPLVIGYSCFIMIVYIGGIIWSIIKFKRIRKEAIFCIFALIFMLVTGIGTTIAIRPIARYVFYSFGLFYISGILLWRGIIRKSPCSINVAFYSIFLE